MKKKILNAVLWAALAGGLLLAILTRILGVAYIGYFSAALAGTALLEVNGYKN
jgi:hypothetical protein